MVPIPRSKSEIYVYIMQTTQYHHSSSCLKKRKKGSISVSPLLLIDESSTQNMIHCRNTDSVLNHVKRRRQLRRILNRGDKRSSKTTSPPLLSQPRASVRSLPPFSGRNTTSLLYLYFAPHDWPRYRPASKLFIKRDIRFARQLRDLPEHQKLSQHSWIAVDADNLAIHSVCWRRSTDWLMVQKFPSLRYHRPKIPSAARPKGVLGLPSEWKAFL